MIHLVIYSRPGCHLCDEMKAIVNRVARRTPIALTEVDISTDRALEAQFATEIPVLMIDGKKVAKYRVTEESLVRMLADRAGHQ